MDFAPEFSDQVHVQFFLLARMTLTSWPIQRNRDAVPRQVGSRLRSQCPARYGASIPKQLCTVQGGGRGFEPGHYDVLHDSHLVAAVNQYLPSTATFLIYLPFSFLFNYHRNSQDYRWHYWMAPSD